MLDFRNETENGGCRVGILLMDNVKGVASQRLDEEKLALETSLRERLSTLSRPELKALHPMDSYISYYKKHGYSYHVLPQLESIVKGKAIPSVIPAVEAMFMAELKNAMLTAGHDYDALALPMSALQTDGSEGYTAMSGKEAVCVKNDFCIADANGIISSILRGPDKRSAITADTKRALYTVYAPAGIEDEYIMSHLDDIECFVRLYASKAVVLEKRII